MTSERLPWAVALGVALLGAGCARLAPTRPRFVTVAEQRTAECRIQIIADTRSAACFVGFRCGRQPLIVVAVEAAVCVP